MESELTRKLLEYLLSGAIEPGGRLPSERTLAEILGLSRQAIRNSLKSLSILGIVETRMGSGTYFVGRQAALLPQVIEWGLLLSQGWVIDLIEARYQLEILFAGLAAERRTGEDVEELRAILERLRSSRVDYEAYAQADAEFHVKLAMASRSTILAGVLVNVASLLKAWSERVIASAGETESSLAMHEAVFRSVAAMDAEGARAAMLAHMDRAVTRLRRSVDDQASLKPADDPEPASLSWPGSSR